jgi:hypothetical protein
MCCIFIIVDAWYRKVLKISSRDSMNGDLKLNLLGYQLRVLNQLYIHFLLLTPLTSKPLGILATEEGDTKIRTSSVPFAHVCGTH